jgi:flavodoxin
MIMYTFFDTYDFSGKTIIPFNTHEGSGDGGTYNEIREFEPDATVYDGLAVRGGSAEKSDEDIDKWLAGLGY